MSRPRVSPEQLDKLLCFMEEHTELASGKEKYGEADGQPSTRSAAHGRHGTTGRLWRTIAESLNAVEGGVKRSPDKWCRYWADLKYKTKKRAQSLHGGESLTDIEERVTKLASTTTKSYNTRRCSTMSDEDDRKPIFNEDSINSNVNPIEQVNLSQGGEPQLNTEEVLAEAAMRTALAMEKQAEAIVHGLEVFRDFVVTVRKDLTALQNAYCANEQGRPLP